MVPFDSISWPVLNNLICFHNFSKPSAGKVAYFVMVIILFCRPYFPLDFVPQKLIGDRVSLFKSGSTGCFRGDTSQV